MELLAEVLSLISIANILVLAMLMGIFTVSYTKTKAQFPLTMIVFCGFLVLHNLIGAQAYFTVGQLFSEQVFPYLLGVHITEFVGLLTFLKITYQ